MAGEREVGGSEGRSKGRGGHLDEVERASTDQT